MLSRLTTIASVSGQSRYALTLHLRISQTHLSIKCQFIGETKGLFVIPWDACGTPTVKIFIDYLFFQADQSDCTKSVSIFNRFASSEERLRLSFPTRGLGWLVNQRNPSGYWQVTKGDLSQIIFFLHDSFLFRSSFFMRF